MTEQPKVTYSEPEYMRVAQELRDKGYFVGAPGTGTTLPYEGGLFIYGTKGVVFKRILTLGHLYLDVRVVVPSAKNDKTWVLEIFGREHVRELTDAVGEIALKHGFGLEARLKKEYPVYRKD